MPHHLAEQIFIGEGRLPGQGMIQDAAHAVDVGTDVDGAGIAGLLRGQVIGGPQQHAFPGQVHIVRLGTFIKEAAQADVEDFHGGLESRVRLAAAGSRHEHQIGRLQVTVDHALLVNVL